MEARPDAHNKCDSDEPSVKVFRVVLNSRSYEILPLFQNKFRGYFGSEGVCKFQLL